MIKTAKRGLALLLALVLCLSSLSGIIPQAEAATYTYNWGAREDTATTADFTRSTAEEWYAAEGTSYEKLSQLSGSKTQSSVPSSALYKALQTLMTNAHDTKTSYDGTKSMYQYTDCQNGGGKISSFYSGNAIGPAWGQGDWNREHTWPKSKSLNGSSNGGQDETDIIMLRPTSTSENSSRGNDAYGERYYDPNSESGGKYNLHGDVARICLYVYVRWGNTQYMWGASGVMESRATLLKWMEEDPVDTWELGRNDAVESITGTRNVFVDYPELGFLLFGEEVPAGYDTPSGSGNGCSHEDTDASDPVAATCVGVGYTAGVYCNDCDSFISGHTQIPALGHIWGEWFETQAPTCTKPGEECAICQRCDDERTRVVAATGHSYTGVTTPPTVTDQGYTTYTCGVCGYSYVGSYTDALGESFTVTFRVPDGVAAVSAMTCGKSGITLPTAAAPQGYTFLGWSAQVVDDTETKPTILTGTYKAPGDVTLHAIYFYTETEGDQQTGTYSLHTGELTEGDYIFYTNTDAMKAATLNGRIDTVAVTVTNNTICDPDPQIVWHVEKTADGYYTIYNEKTGVYAAGNGTKNKAALITSLTDYAKWTVTGSTTYDFVNKGNKAKGVNANLRWNSATVGWATYASSFQTAPQLYKGVTGTTYYTTLTASAVAEVNGSSYQTLEAAIEAAGGSTVKLLQSSTAAATVTGTVYMDLNGFTARLNADKLYVMDSTATTTAAGNGCLVTDSQVVTQWGEFIALAGETGYSAHKFELKLTTVTLRTEKAGVYYKASLSCDPVLRERISGCGVTLSLDGGAQLRTRYSGAPTDEFTSGSVFNIFKKQYSAERNAARGELEIYANAYLELADGTIITDQGGVAQSLRDVLAYLDASFDTLTAQEQTQLQAFAAAWKETLALWNLQNI